MLLFTKVMNGTYIRPRIHILLIYILCTAGFAIGTNKQAFRYGNGPPRILETDQKPISTTPQEPINLSHFTEGLDVLQHDHFAIWQGIWPSSIDWTSAVIGTYISAALTTLSTSYSSLVSEKDGENTINKYFSQLVGSYFGQDAFSLRQEAYDDMLWVVLGWLESIKFINTHSSLHYSSAASEGGTWYGRQYIPAFAHRARIFWEMASAGWDTTLCDGGMIWSPYLTPYKNAITNELYIAASISMYLYFPGDSNTSPFGFSSRSTLEPPPGRPHDPKYLAAAIEAYMWLNGSNMTDDMGLYVDGYHVSGWSKEQPKNSTANRCDERNEMVYTYNQGVLLTGQRGLFEATGARSYLTEGHALVSSVITATGWDISRNVVVDAPPDDTKLGKWHGLGRSGILEELCDGRGDCSQDSQTFKGIFFHHLTAFCMKLPDHLVLPEHLFIGKGVGQRDFEDDKQWHEQECTKYSIWIKHNAAAALTTKNSNGNFGMWWGAPKRRSPWGGDVDGEVDLPANAVDYRNQGVPRDWEDTKKHLKGPRDVAGMSSSAERKDLNDRGRGRTVETQGGGISVLRAMWEISGRL